MRWPTPAWRHGLCPWVRFRQFWIITIPACLATLSAVNPGNTTLAGSGDAEESCLGPFPRVHLGLMGLCGGLCNVSRGFGAAAACGTGAFKKLQKPGRSLRPVRTKQCLTEASSLPALSEYPISQRISF